MRVTDRLIFNNAIVNAGRARERDLAATQEVSTGLKVTHPGDDPAAAGLIAGYRVAISQADSVMKTVQRASDETISADGALDGVGSVLSRARELAVQLSNSTYSAEQRAAAANEVDGLFREALGQLNSHVGNRYLFGGFADSVPPFDATGAYLGDTGVRQVEVAPGVLQASSIRADVAIKGVNGGVDVLSTLTALSAALTANNVAGVQATLTGLDTGIAQVASARSSLGSSMSLFDAAGEAARAHRDTQTANLSHLADSDPIEANSRLALAERALDASLTAAAASFKLTMLGKL